MRFFSLHILSIHTVLLQFAILILMVMYNQLRGAWLLILCIIKKKANKCSKRKQSFKLIWIHFLLWVVFLSLLDSVIKSRIYEFPFRFCYAWIESRCLHSGAFVAWRLFAHKKKIKRRRQNPREEEKSNSLSKESKLEHRRSVQATKCESTACAGAVWEFNTLLCNGFIMDSYVY